MTWTDALWQDVDPTYRAILDHPFLHGLTDGTLPEDRFRYYLAQDAHYLRDYARALAVVGAKAPTHAQTAMFARHAAETVAVELSLHAELLDVDPETVAVSPTTTSYTSYLLVTAYGGSFADGLAAVLPCYWIYQRVGTELVNHGSPAPMYQRWIDTYGGEQFAAVVAEVLDVADRTGERLGPEQDRKARRHFAVTARYEWMFWDAAWRLEQWPLA